MGGENKAYYEHIIISLFISYITKLLKNKSFMTVRD